MNCHSLLAAALAASEAEMPKRAQRVKESGISVEKKR
jgi:biotin operon repressor